MSLCVKGRVLWNSIKNKILKIANCIKLIKELKLMQIDSPNQFMSSILTNSL